MKLNNPWIQLVKIRCQERQFTLHYYDEIPFYLESSLHEMLQYVRKEQSQLTAVLIRGPADWGNKQTTIAHVTVPLDQAGTWSVIHPDFDELSDRYAYCIVHKISNWLSEGKYYNRWAFNFWLQVLQFFASNFAVFFLNFCNFLFQSLVFPVSKGYVFLIFRLFKAKIFFCPFLSWFRMPIIVRKGVFWNFFDVS